MKEAFVFPSLCELLNRPRQHSAHTDISDNTRAGKHRVVVVGGGGQEVTVEKIRPLVSLGSAVQLWSRKSKTATMLRGEKKETYQNQLKLLKMIVDKSVI